MNHGNENSFYSLFAPHDLKPQLEALCNTSVLAPPFLLDNLVTSSKKPIPVVNIDSFHDCL